MFVPRWVGLLVILSACSRPDYVDQGAGQSEAWVGQPVKYQVFESFRASPPDCIGVLALGGDNAQESDLVRKSLYAHLAAQARRGVPLAHLDRAVAETGDDLASLGERTHCGAMLRGRVTEFGDRFLVLYSRVAVGVDLQLVRTSDGRVLWQGQHVAVSHGGSLPLDVVGVAMAMTDAVGNVTNDEQTLRLTDDVARRLLSTIPEGSGVALDDPPSLPLPPADSLARAEAKLAAGDAAAAIAIAQAELDAGRFHGGAAWLLKGRGLLQMHDAAAADAALIQAVAVGGKQPLYLNALGAAAAARGQWSRALAAYDMALAVDRGDGFAWYNSAVLLLGQQRWQAAADRFYGGGLAYLKNSDYVRAERCLHELRNLDGQHGLKLDERIRYLESAMNQGKGKAS